MPSTPHPVVREAVLDCWVYVYHSFGAVSSPVFNFYTEIFGAVTQVLTQNGKGAGGISGDSSAGKHPTPEQTRPKSAKKPPPAPLAAAHNPKVVGSNPAPATIKTAVFTSKAAVFIIFSVNSILGPLEKFNFNSTHSKIQAFFKNTSASISALRWSASSMTWA